MPIQKKKEKNADPRFDERAGKFNDDLFKKSFSFINEMKKQEKEAIVKKVKKIKNPEEKHKLKRVLQQMVCVCVQLVLTSLLIIRFVM